MHKPDTLWDRIRPGFAVMGFVFLVKEALRFIATFI